MDTKRLGQREASASTSLTAPRRHTGRTVDAATLLCFVFCSSISGWVRLSMAALAKHQKIKEPFCFQRQHWAWNGRLPPAALLPSRLERFWTSFHQHQRGGLGWFLRALVLHAEAAAGTHDPLGRFRVPFSVFFRFLRPESLADVAGGGAAGGRVRPRWTWLENWVLLCFTGLFGGFTRIYLVLPTFYWVSPSCTGFYRVLPSFAGFYRVLTAFYCFFFELERDFT